MTAGGRIGVTIDAGGRCVKVEARASSLSEAADAALRLWQATEGAVERPRIEGASGFLLERADPE